MHAFIDKHGTLTLTPQDQTEDYALQKWFDDYTQKKGGAMLQAQFTRGGADVTRLDAQGDSCSPMSPERNSDG